MLKQRCLTWEDSEVTNFKQLFETAKVKEVTKNKITPTAYVKELESVKVDTQRKSFEAE
jgi:hypothetical protein